jgi:hypothetical protein
MMIRNVGHVARVKEKGRMYGVVVGNKKEG